MLADSVKRIYEAMFLVDAAAAAANWDGVADTIQTVFERASAEVVNLRKWDERRLCYEIAGHKRGTYILCYFRAAPESIGSIERDVKLNESLLRVMIVKADHLTTDQMDEPTPFMREMREDAPQEDTEPVPPVDSGSDDLADQSPDEDALLADPDDSGEPEAQAKQE